MLIGRFFIESECCGIFVLKLMVRKICDDDIVICFSLINLFNLNWRVEVRSELLDEMNVKFVLEGFLIDDYNKELEELLIKSFAYN